MGDVTNNNEGATTGDDDTTMPDASSSSSSRLMVAVAIGLFVVLGLAYWYFRKHETKDDPAAAVSAPDTAPPPPSPTPKSSSYTSTLPASVQTRILVHYDATDGSNVLGTTAAVRSAGGAVARWRPSETSDDGRRWELQTAVRTGVATGPELRFIGTGTDAPGVFLPTGTMLGTGSGGATLSLFNRAVFLVVTVHRQSNTPNVRHLLGNRGLSDPKGGDVFLRVDADNTHPEGPYVVYADLGAGNFVGSPFGRYQDRYGPPLDAPFVWAFQLVTTTTTTTLKRIGLAGAQFAVETVTLPNGGVNVAYANELTLGGWRNAPPVNTDAGTESGNCTVHEVVVTTAPLDDADLLATYNGLRTKWRVVT